MGKKNKNFLKEIQKDPELLGIYEARVNEKGSVEKSFKQEMNDSIKPTDWMRVSKFEFEFNNSGFTGKCRSAM